MILELFNFLVSIGITLVMLMGFLYVLSAMGLFSFLVVIKEYERAILFRLGRFKAVLDPGLHLVIPFVDQVMIVDMRLRSVDIPRQEMMTKDNVPVNIDGVVYYRVIDPKKAVLGLKNYDSYVRLFSQTTLRDMVGTLELDSLLTRREEVAEELREVVDREVDKWGLDIHALKLQNIELPQELKRAMARQAEAERERRANIIKSEGEVKAAENYLKAAEKIGEHPAALSLRFLQTLTDISADPSQKYVLVIPPDLLKALYKK